MANLKADLDSYLSGSKTASSSQHSLASLANSFSLPTLKSPFNRGAKEDGSAEDLEVLIDSGSSSSGKSGSGEQSRCRKWIDSALPSLSYKQRMIGFMTCLVLGLICFAWSTIYIPMLVFKARKFALLFSLGSAFVMGAFGMMWGPWDTCAHLFSKERLTFTATYFGSLGATLYFAMGMQSTILTTIAASFQVMALLWFIVSYLPGGQTGLRYMSAMCGTMCKKTARSSLPI